ncbi:MAG: hypothetical protein ACI9B9_001867 [Halioglobus sp.]|jgi:hypothetical protein
MISVSFLILGCLIFVLLGSVHWWSAVRSSKFEPRDDSTLELMKNGHSKITDQSTIWDSVTGFHVSHSVGLIFYGILFITLAVENPRYLYFSTVLTAFLLLLPVLYIVLAQKYWFSLPRNGFMIAFLLVVFSVVLR